MASVRDRTKILLWVTEDGTEFIEVPSKSPKQKIEVIARAAFRGLAQIFKHNFSLKNAHNFTILIYLLSKKIPWT